MKKVNDKVLVYGNALRLKDHLYPYFKGQEGIVHKILNNDGICVKMTESKDIVLVHPNQCKKVKL